MQKAVKKQVLVNAFGFTKTCFVLVLLGPPETYLPKHVFFNHEQKVRRKLASPVRDKNSQNIAYWYKTYIRRNKKNKKSFGRLKASALEDKKYYKVECENKNMPSSYVGVSQLSSIPTHVSRMTYSFLVIRAFPMCGTVQFRPKPGMYQVPTYVHSCHGLLPPTTNHKQENHGRI